MTNLFTRFRYFLACFDRISSLIPIHSDGGQPRRGPLLMRIVVLASETDGYILRHYPGESQAPNLYCTQLTGS